MNKEELISLFENPNLNWDQTCTVILSLLDVTRRDLYSIVPILADMHPKTLLQLLHRLNPSLKIFMILDEKYESIFAESGYNLIYYSIFVNDKNTALLLKLFCQIFNLTTFRPVIEGKKISFDGCYQDEENILSSNLYRVFSDAAQMFPENEQNLKKPSLLIQKGRSLPDCLSIDLL